MAEHTRDPKLDPIAGDVFQGVRDTFYVTRVRNGTVFYTDKPPVEEMSCPIEDWRQWSKSDSVIERGDAKATESDR